MRYIPTTELLVEKFEQSAQRLKRSSMMKRVDALNRVARSYGYGSWGHVKWCLNETSCRYPNGNGVKVDLIDPKTMSFTDEVKYIIGCAEMRAQTVVCIESCVLFSTFDGDAWLLDILTNQALCLSWQGERQSYRIEETATTFLVEYDAQYVIDQDSFCVKSDNLKIGNRTIGLAYPTDEICSFAEAIRSQSDRT